MIQLKLSIFMIIVKYHPRTARQTHRIAIVFALIPSKRKGGGRPLEKAKSLYEKQRKNQLHLLFI